jgi:hypothetical protein
MSKKRRAPRCQITLDPRPRRKSEPRAKATLRSPTTREAEAIADAADRISKRRKRVQASIEGCDAGECRIASKHSDGRGWSAQLTDAFGTTSEDFANVTLTQTMNALPLSEDSLPRMTNAVLATVDGTKPKDEIEAMLTSQMVVTHALAMDFIGRARRAEHVTQLDSCGGLAVKLLRTYTAQVEALAKLRRGGEQTVRVEHVHVHAGGQAVVGNVNQREAGGLNESSGQPHATGQPRALTFTPGRPVRSAHPERHPVPVASGEGKAPLPNARRRKG